MKVGYLLFLIVVLEAGCGEAGSPQPTVVYNAGDAMRLKNLSIPADFLLTALAVAAPERLTASELSDNAAMYGDGFREGIEELKAMGLARQSSEGAYELTEAGAAYVEQRYEVIRNGDSVIVKKREGTPR